MQQLSATYLPFAELPIEEGAGGNTHILEVAVSGSDVTDEVARMALRLRTAELFYAGDMVTSIKIENSVHFTSLWAIDELFGDNNTSGRSGDVMFSRSRVKRTSLSSGHHSTRHGEDENGEMRPSGMGSAFEDMLRTGVMKLIVTNCHSVHSIPSTFLSNLQSLIHLNLSNNKIREIQGEFGLQLPHLKRLNLSNNLLKSLDKLQSLPNLIALDASANYIQTLHHGPHMLLPLARNLISLNLLNNPICSLPSYAGETVSLLPNLVCFDMRYTKLYKLRKSANAKNAPVPALPSEDNHSRVISVPRSDSTANGSPGGHDFVLIEKNAGQRASPSGYSTRHSPSKRSKHKESPMSAAKERHIKRDTGSPELIPFYPTYGVFRASPGVLLETNSKGYGQKHKKESQLQQDDYSVDSSINSVDSTEGKNNLIAVVYTTHPET